MASVDPIFAVRRNVTKVVHIFELGKIKRLMELAGKAYELGRKMGLSCCLWFSGRTLVLTKSQYRILAGGK